MRKASKLIPTPDPHAAALAITTDAIRLSQNVHSGQSLLTSLTYHSVEWYVSTVMENLTNVQSRLLMSLRKKAEAGEPPPSYRELCDQFGWSSTGTVRDHLQALARKGYVDLPNRRGGRVRLRESSAPVKIIPVLGRITAGVPVMSEQNVEGHLPVPADWIRGGQYFALNVDGDSMEGAGIFKGDCVIVRSQQVAGTGEIVAATVDGETTLKRLVKRHNRFFLVPENPNYQPIEITSDSAIIHGLIVGLLRNYQRGSMSRHEHKH